MRLQNSWGPELAEVPWRTGVLPGGTERREHPRRSPLKSKGGERAAQESMRDPIRKAFSSPTCSVTDGKAEGQRGSSSALGSATHSCIQHAFPNSPDGEGTLTCSVPAVVTMPPLTVSLSNWKSVCSSEDRAHQATPGPCLTHCRSQLSFGGRPCPCLLEKQDCRQCHSHLSRVSTSTTPDRHKLCGKSALALPVQCESWPLNASTSVPPNARSCVSEPPPPSQPHPGSGL